MFIFKRLCLNLKKPYTLPGFESTITLFGSGNSCHTYIYMIDPTFWQLDSFNLVRKVLGSNYLGAISTISSCWLFGVFYFFKPENFFQSVFWYIQVWPLTTRFSQIILSGQSQAGGASQVQLNPSAPQPRSLSPVSCQSGDDLGYANPGRKSLRSRRPLLDKQVRAWVFTTEWSDWANFRRLNIFAKYNT
jgi:hypothetical protein